MEVNDDLIDKLSDLAKLEFEGEEREQIKHDLTRILTFMGKLNELDTNGVEPLIYMNEDANILREDRVETTINKQDALDNAPDKDSDYIKVSKVLDRK